MAENSATNVALGPEFQSAIKYKGAPNQKDQIIGPPSCQLPYARHHNPLLIINCGF